MIPQELIDRLDRRQLLLQRRPIHLEHPTDGKAVHLLHERKHTRPEAKHAQFPRLELGVDGPLAPEGRLSVLGPGFCEDSLGVLELEKVPEEELVPENRLARDDEREREFDRVVESEGLPGCKR